MKLASHIPLICILISFGVPLLNAKDLATYRVGSVAEADLITPVALDVVDPTATAVLQAAQALKTPAIFYQYPDPTNALAGQFQITFDTAHSNFISAIQDTFHETVLDHAAVTSPDFGYLVTAFNITHKKFPVPDFLAMDWAYGKTGEVEKNKLLNSLLEAMRHKIRPDDLPSGFQLGESLRLVTMNHPGETLPPAAAETSGQIISGADLLTVSQAQQQWRQRFTNYEEQPLARALADLLQPNCVPDAALTKTARELSVRQLIVAEHYAAGQIIVRQGSVIDAKTKAVLDELNEKPVAEKTVAVLSDQTASVATVAALSQPIAAPAPLAQNVPGKISGQAVSAPVKNISPNHKPLIVAIFIVAGGILFLLWRLILRSRVTSVSVLPKDLPSQNQFALQTELAPQLARIVRETLVHELATQRRDLLFVQQTAAGEVSRLVRKMDGLQLAMQERLQAYESQIQNLETELAARSEENRELIRLKIEMIREQLAVESTGKRMEFN